MNDAQRCGEIVCDGCHKAVERLAGITFAVRSGECACLGGPKTINQPADDDGNYQE
jgi:hypothetical protein